MGSRPQKLKTWLKSGKRSLERLPVVINASTYRTEWVKWWASAQPQGRDTQQWPFSRGTGIVDWGKFAANGGDGIYLAVMALSWWAPAVRSSNEIAFFEEAVTDLHWVVQELIRVRTASQLSPSSSTSPQDESSPRRPKPNPHRPKPTPLQANPTSGPSVSTSRPPLSSSGVHTHQRTEGKRVVKPSWRVLASQ